MTQFAVVNEATREVVAFRNAETQPQNAGGLLFFEQEPALDGWPAEPFPGAVLMWGDAGRYWLDARTDEQRAAAARAERDALLQGTDWRVMRAVELGQPLEPVWVTYRQALRDVPLQPGFPNSFTMPVPPAP